MKFTRHLASVIGIAVLAFGLSATTQAQTWEDPATLNKNAGMDTGGDYYPNAASDGNGTWISVWHSTEPNIGGGIGGDYDILYARSTDDGANWAAPAALNTNAGADTRTDNCPQVKTDGNGTWVVVWFSNEANIGGGIGTDYDILYARSTDNGVTWSDPAALNTNAGTDTGNDWFVKFATDRNGNWIAVWHSDEANIGGGIGTDEDILYARSSDNGATWTVPTALNTDAGTDGTQNDRNPTVTTDGYGTWIAVWEELRAISGDAAKILYARSTDNGATWTDPATLYTNATDLYPCRPILATDGTGTVIAVWESSYGVQCSRSTDNGATWPVPVTLTNSNFLDATFPKMTTDAKGRWIVVWRGEEDPSTVPYYGDDADIMFVSSQDNGITWTTSSALNRNAGTDGATDDDAGPMLATDGKGVWLAVWNSSAADIDGGIGKDSDILYSTCLWRRPDGFIVRFFTDGTPGATVNGAVCVTYTVAPDAACTPVTAGAPVDGHFVQWTGNYVSAANPLVIASVTGNMDITAVFATKHLTVGTVFDLDAADIEMQSEDTKLFRVKPKVYAMYANPVTHKYCKASAKVLTKISKKTGPVPSIACEWTKKIKLYDAKAFKASEAGGVGAAAWITETHQEDLVVNVRLVSKDARDQAVQSMMLAAPTIDTIVPGAPDPKGNATLVITGRWFGTKNPKVWREYVDAKTGIKIKRQAMKVLKLTVVNTPYLNSKGKPSCMDPASGDSIMTVIVPADPAKKGTLNGTIVLDNGVGIARGDAPEI